MAGINYTNEQEHYSKPLKPNKCCAAVTPQLLCLTENKYWSITKGRKYKMILEDDRHYHIIDDKGKKDFYFKRHFEVIAQ